MIIDLFAGAGGWSTGLRATGHTGPAAGIEWNLTACRTARAAGHHRICADVTTYPIEPLTGTVTGLTASPPCTTFSGAGTGAGRLVTAILIAALTRTAQGQSALSGAHRDCARVLTAHALTHRRLGKLTRAERSAWAWRQAVTSALVVQPLRWVITLQPRWVALEQVPAVLPLWRHTAMLLRGHGYSAWCGILSAETYGVPQTRKRAILIASLDGPAGPPTPTHQPYRAGTRPDTEGDLFGAPLPSPVSMAQALGWAGASQRRTRGAGITERGGERPDRDNGSGPPLNWVMRSNYGTGGDPQNRGQRHADQCSGTVTSKASRNVWLRNGPERNATERDPDQPAPTIYSSRDGNLTWRSRPATTICGDARLAPPGHRDRAGGEPQFGTGAVRVTIHEAAILQGFPPDYPWQGTATQQYRQIGDAVPPPLATAILRPLLTATQERAA